MTIIDKFFCMLFINILFLFPVKSAAQFPDWTVYTTENSRLPIDLVEAVAINQNGNLWVGTASGLAKFDGQEWTVYESSNSGIPDVRVTSLLLGGDDVWVGTVNGLARFTGDDWTVFKTVNSDIPHNLIRSLALAANGNLWVGTLNGLAIFDGIAWTVYTTANSELPENDIESLATGVDGDSWIGTNNGLALLRDSVFTDFTTANSPLPNNDIDAILVETSGIIWVGTEAGLAKYDGAKWWVYDTGNSALLNDHIEDLALDSSGHLWLGTGNGLASFDGGQFTVYSTTNSDLPDDRVNSVAVEANGIKWIGTKNGLARFTGGFVRILQIATPAGGEIWQAGRSFAIEWESKGEVGPSVKIDLYKGEVLNRTIASGVANSGSYLWGVPTEQVSGSDYKIKISDVADSLIFDFSNDFFTINEKPAPPSRIRIVSSQPYLNSLNSVGMRDGTVYWYFDIRDEADQPVVVSEIKLTLSSANGAVTPVIETFADGVLRIDMAANSSGLSRGESTLFTFPDSILVDNHSAALVVKPEPLPFAVVNRSYQISWDFFAGRSAGVSGIVGGAGAGPSVSAARLSVKGVAGAGMNIAVNENDFTQISRHFEAGVGVGVKVPAINSAVGKVNVGAQAELIAKGLLGQTVLFDHNLKSDEVKMAKTGYMLETLSLGGAILSPTAGIVLRALIATLNNLAGVDKVFQDFLLENFYGLGLEGKVGVGVSAKLGDNSPIGLTFAEAMARLALQAKYIDELRQANFKKFALTTALDYKFNALKFSLIPFKQDDDKMELQSGNFSLFSAGVGMSVGQTVLFDPLNKPREFRIDLEGGTNVNAIFNQVDIYNTSFLTRIIIPENVLENLLNTANNGILNLTRAFNDPTIKVSQSIGPRAMVNNLTGLMDSFSDHFSPDDKPVSIEIFEKQGNGMDLSLNVSLDAALGVGAGIDLGFEFKHYESLEYLRSRSLVLAHNRTYLTESFPDDLRPQDFPRLQAVMTDLFSGLDELLLAAFKNLVQEVLKVVKAFKEFVADVNDQAEKTVARVTGTLKKAGQFVIRKFSSFSPRILFKAFEAPRVKNMYFTNKIAYRHTDGSLRLATENSRLYIVGDNFSLNFYPDAGGFDQSFDSELLFSLAVQEDLLQQAGFSPEDKGKIRMYQYVDSSLTWIRLEDDLNAGIDTVASLITQAGSYALGIEVRPDEDDQAPLLNEISPEDGSSVSPTPLLKAKITDQITGSGVDVARCQLILDEIVLEANWAPTDNELFFQVSDSLSDGPHEFKVIGVDLNGNVVSVAVSFFVGLVESVAETTGPRSFEIFQNYPNPFNAETRIKYYLPQSGEVEVNIYDVTGRYVRSLVREFQVQGDHVMTWDGTNTQGRIVASGIYFYQVKFDDFNFVKRMTLVK